MSDAGDAIDRMIARIIGATEEASKDGADIVQSLARANVKSRTYELAESITTLGPRPTGVAQFATDVGPTAVYGRIHELGGHIYPHGHPYLAFYWPEAPSAMRRLPDGRVLAKHIYQPPHPYLKPAVEEAALRFREIATRKWGDAIRVSVGLRGT